MLLGAGYISFDGGYNNGVTASLAMCIYILSMLINADCV